MKKLLITLFIVIFLPLKTLALELPNLYSSKVILYDPTDEEILYEKGSTEITHIASLTKIMTTILAIEKIGDLEKTVTITDQMLKEVPWDASIAGLKVDETFTFKDLLYASMLPSGADATTALAHSISGSTPKYVEEMNKKAKEIGLKDTIFTNVTGYDGSGQSSTLNDVLKMLLYSLQNPLFKEIYYTNSYTLANGLEVKSTIELYNKFVNRDTSQILGSKTGYTGKAGTCMSAVIESNDKELIIISVGAPYAYRKAYNLEDTLNIIDYLNENYAIVTLLNDKHEVFKLPVEDSIEENYSVVSHLKIEKYTEKDYDKSDFRYEYEGLDKLSYKNDRREKIGHIKYFYRDEFMGEEDIYLEEVIHFSFDKFVKKYYVEILVYICGALVLIVIYAKKRKKKSKKV